MDLQMLYGIFALGLLLFAEPISTWITQELRQADQQRQRAQKRAGSLNRTARSRYYN